MMAETGLSIGWRKVGSLRLASSPERLLELKRQVGWAKTFGLPLELIGLLSGKDVLVGAIDVATDRVETPEGVAATIRAALKYVPAERVYPCANCGMVPLGRGVARAKLKALGTGAALVRQELT